MKRRLLPLLALLAVAHVASALDKPSPYHLKFVEYIESNSDKLAYINTGYVPNANTEIEMDFAFTRTNLTLKTYVFGAYDKDSRGRFQFSYGPDSLGCFFGYGTSYTNSFRGLPYNTERHVVKYVPGSGKGFYFDGNRVDPPGVNLTSWVGTGTNLYLCALNSKGSSVTTDYIAPLRIYSCKIWENGILKRNFLPALTDASAASLYDTVRRKFHTNANTYWDNEEKKTKERGMFIAGEEVTPTDYRKATYIEANRTAYIDTEYVPNENTELEMAFAFTSLTNLKTYVFGTYGSHDCGRFQFSYGPADTGCFFGYGSGFDRTVPGLPYNTDRHVVKYVRSPAKGFYFDDIFVNTNTLANLTTWSDTSANLFLGQINPDGGNLNPTNLAPIRIYSCKIWEGNEMKRDLVPRYRVYDNKNGLYDKVTGNFYAYGGTRADFTAVLTPLETVIFVK